MGSSKRIAALDAHAQVVTQLGSIDVVVGLAAVLAFAEWRRTGGRWILPFIVMVLAGEELAPR